MKVETKFNVGDTMFPITYNSRDIINKCPVCEGSTIVTILETQEKILCHRCHGAGTSIERAITKWYVNGTIGRVIGLANIAVRTRNKEIISIITYSAVGSGNTFPEEDVFCSEKEAQAECNKRNKKIAIKEGEK